MCHAMTKTSSADLQRKKLYPWIRVMFMSLFAFVQQIRKENC